MRRYDFISIMVLLALVFQFWAAGCGTVSKSTNTEESSPRLAENVTFTENEKDNTEMVEEIPAINEPPSDQQPSLPLSGSEKEEDVQVEDEEPEEVVIESDEPESYIIDQTMSYENNDIEIFHITYMSDGLKVKGYLAQPKEQGIYPAVIYNRGGNLEFGKLSGQELVVYASNDFVAIGSQYRGNDGGEGKEEFGGEDINDVMNLIPILKSMPNVDSEKIAMVGYSRGGMMTYLALKEQTLRGIDDIKAACTVGGTADLFINAEARDDMVNGVFIPLIGGTPDQLHEEFEARSATYWADLINTPVLIQHGEADWRVLPEESIKLAEELEKYDKEYKLITYPGDDHGLSNHARGYNEIFEWLGEYLDVTVNVNFSVSTTPVAEPGIIEGEYYINEDKGYKIVVPPSEWEPRSAAQSAPMDTMFILNEIGKYGWFGSGAFSGPAYTQDFFNGINAWWVPAITEKSGATEIEIVDEGELTIFDYDAKYVKFNYIQSGKQYTEITYHIWRPDKPYSLYRFRLICWQELFEQFYPLFEDFIYSIKFLG